jgi:hypothetical protein
MEVCMLSEWVLSKKVFGMRGMNVVPNTIVEHLPLIISGMVGETCYWVRHERIVVMERVGLFNRKILYDFLHRCYLNVELIARNQNS